MVSAGIETIRCTIVRCCACIWNNMWLHFRLLSNHQRFDYEADCCKKPPVQTSLGPPVTTTQHVTYFRFCWANRQNQRQHCLPCGSITGNLAISNCLPVTWNMYKQTPTTLLGRQLTTLACHFFAQKGETPSADNIFINQQRGHKEYW